MSCLFPEMALPSWKKIPVCLCSEGFSPLAHVATSTTLPQEHSRYLQHEPCYSIFMSDSFSGNKRPYFCPRHVSFSLDLFLNFHSFPSWPSTHSIYLLTVYRLQEQKACQNGGFNLRKWNDFMSLSPENIFFSGPLG